MAVFDFIEGFYNPRRRHSSLGQVSPVNFERRHARESVIALNRWSSSVRISVCPAIRRWTRRPSTRRPTDRSSLALSSRDRTLAVAGYSER